MGRVIAVHIVVCLAPVLDPKIPAGKLERDESGQGVRLEGVPHVLGPFDEAALETALKLRDRGTDVRVSALVAGGKETDESLRYVMALKPDATKRIEIGANLAWDCGSVAAALAEAVATLDLPVDVLLMGPEFGDRDDGMVAPALADILGWTFFAGAHGVSGQDGTLTLVRDAGDCEERLVIGSPVVATISTHPDTRLRLPLLKSIMAAGRAPVSAMTIDSLPVLPSAMLETLRITQPSPRGGVPCQMITGSPEEQAERLARLLQGALT